MPLPPSKKIHIGRRWFCYCSFGFWFIFSMLFFCFLWFFGTCVNRWTMKSLAMAFCLGLLQTRKQTITQQSGCKWARDIDKNTYQNNRSDNRQFQNSSTVASPCLYYPYPYPSPYPSINCSPLIPACGFHYPGR